MKSIKIRSTLIVLSSLTYGCATVTAESSFKEKAIERASFDLHCPKDKLDLKVLHRNDGLGCAGSQMGVSGCKKQAVYVCDEWQNWVRNSAVQK